MLSILTKFISNRSPHTEVTVSSVEVNWSTSCQKCRRVILYTSELYYILENKLIGYADDLTLIAVVPSRGVRVTVAESLSLDPIQG